MCSSFSAKTCTNSQALIGFSSTNNFALLFPFPLRLSLSLAALSSLLLMFLSHVLWHIQQELLIFSIRLQWITSHVILLYIDTADDLARRGVLLQPSTVPCSLFPLVSRIYSFLFSDWKCTVLSHQSFRLIGPLNIH